MDHLLFLGSDGETEYLLTVWDDGTHQVATRPAAGGTRATWSPPTIVTQVPAEVCS